MANKTNMLVFNLTTYGKPYLYKIIEAKNIRKELCDTLQAGVGGFFENISKKHIKDAKIVIHGMFKQENEKWAIAEKLLHHQYSKVYINENGANTCCPNMATVVFNKAYQIGGCPHLFGEIIVCISQNHYEKFCDKPLEYWNEEKEEEEEDDDDDDEEEEKKEN